MRHRFQNTMVGLFAITWIAAATAHQAQPHAGQDQDAHHREMMARGAQAMGFDQDRTVHHFVLDKDGGAIEVSVKEKTDLVDLHAIRQHLQEIAGLFKSGDFGKPALTHGRQVPGTAEMTRLKDRITYQYEETPAGGRVRILTHDAKALEAVHAFLHFQIQDHQTGDSGVVQQSTPGGMGHGPDAGMAGMMGGSHDADTMAQMREIHELFMNHDRITRTVTNLPNGIRTVTESDDPRIAQTLKEHVTGSNQRVEAGQDPGLPTESEALRLIYRNHDKIHTTLETTATGMVVTQTSSDPKTIAALQQHASEVTDFVKNGMAAMMKGMGGMMRSGMSCPMMGTASGSSPKPDRR